MLPSQYSENRWLQTERKVTILTMPMGTKRKKKDASTRLPVINAALSTKNQYFQLFSKKEELKLPPIEHHHQELRFFKEFAEVNDHYQERREAFHTCVGKEKAIHFQIEWIRIKNEILKNKNQLCHRICNQYSADLQMSLHKMITSYAKGEIQLASLNARKYAEKEDKKREEEVGRQFREIKDKLLWKHKCETFKIVNITNFIKIILE